MKHRYKRLTALLVLVATLVAVTMATTSTVAAVDLSQPCALKINPGGDKKIREDLKEAGVVIDLYRVATAREAAGDTYTYEFLDAFQDLRISDDPDNAVWRDLSRRAASIALGDGSGVSPVVTGAESGAFITRTNDGNNLTAGLYLVVARGQGMGGNYITTVTDESGNEQIATQAMSQTYVYTYAPELVSLPGKEADADSINTARPSEWLYEVTVTLKPEQSKRGGSLEIMKTMLSYSPSSGPAVIVFSVEGVLNGDNVYSDVVSLYFTEPGQQSVVLDGLPVGAQITVEEIYQGACYSLTTDETQTSVIPSDGIVTVSFTGTYEPIANSGGGYNARYEYADITGGWILTEDYAGQ